jgi:gas vesicle protein
MTMDDPRDDDATRPLPPLPPPRTKATGSSYRRVVDPHSASLLGVGLIVGVAIGAGVAMLFAPQSGKETRKMLRGRVRRIRGETRVWERLGKELKRAASLKRKEIELARKTAELERERRNAEAGKV